MNCLKYSPLLAAALAGALLAGTPVAKLTTPDAVTVKGVALPNTNQVAAYPLSLNDEIATKDKPASLEFADGSKVTVAAGSTVRLEQGKSGTAVRVLRGNVAYRLTAQSRVEILNASGQRIGGAMDTRMVKALAVTSVQQPSVRRSTSSNALDSGSSDLLARTYITGGAHATSPAASIQIVLPNGMTLIVTPASGNPNSYTIQQILVPVTPPAGGGGAPTSIPVSSGPLIGATLTVPAGPPPSNGAPTSSVSITMPGQTTPLPPDQAAQQLANTAQQGVNSAISQGQLPPGTTPTPPNAPVSTPPPPASPAPPPALVSNR